MAESLLMKLPLGTAPELSQEALLRGIKSMAADIKEIIDGVKPEVKRANVIYDMSNVKNHVPVSSEKLVRWIESIKRPALETAEGTNLHRIVDKMFPMMKKAVDDSDPELLNGITRLLICKLTAYRMMLLPELQGGDEDEDAGYDLPESIYNEYQALEATMEECNRFVYFLEHSRAAYSLSKRTRDYLMKIVEEWKHHEVTAIHETVAMIVGRAVPALFSAIESGNIVTFTDLLISLRTSLLSIHGRLSNPASPTSNQAPPPLPPSPHHVRFPPNHSSSQGRRRRRSSSSSSSISRPIYGGRKGR
mmetsp:Transcript_18723/g.37844  ORF Transcript_18723/g.37844 Transcript_18723/m.37844 type:complete len:305 (-) Transcript_18723:417-1331(-)